MDMPSRSLSVPQASALKEAAAGPLYRTRAGWGRDGWHSDGTVKSLARRELLTVYPLGGCMGKATITKAGRTWAHRLSVAP